MLRESLCIWRIQRTKITTKWVNNFDLVDYKRFVFRHLSFPSQLLDGKFRIQKCLTSVERWKITLFQGLLSPFTFELNFFGCKQIKNTFFLLSSSLPSFWPAELFGNIYVWCAWIFVGCNSNVGGVHCYDIRGTVLLYVRWFCPASCG